MPLSHEQFVQCVDAARMAPSVHNTQLTRWRMLPDGTVLIEEASERRLLVGDPAGRDALVSHGAAIEGFALAAAEFGFSVELKETEGSVARLSLTVGAKVDPLSAFTRARRTYRGRLRPAPAEFDLSSLDAQGDVAIASTRAEISDLAKMNDAASLFTFRDGAFRAELLSWMRLSSKHPAWSLDGLNAEAMNMSAFEASSAAFVLKPKIFEALDNLGLARHLVAEASTVESASAIVLFHRPDDESLLLTGRRFYRLWLEITALGLSAAPMAVLADNPQTRAALSAKYDLESSRRLITTFRIGVGPPAPPTGRARLAVADMIFE